MFFLLIVVMPMGNHKNTELYFAGSLYECTYTRAMPQRSQDRSPKGGLRERNMSCYSVSNIYLLAFRQISEVNMLMKKADFHGSAEDWYRCM